ncbi:MAG: polysaccharide export protein [Alphaproteobacteria bacterium]|nr:polysaccharide export protein [Alphaproteobacteria bacterium]
MTDRLVGNSDPDSQTSSGAVQQALSVPPNVNDRPLPAPSQAAVATAAAAPARPMTAQMAAAQSPAVAPAQPPAAAMPLAPSLSLQTAAVNPAAPSGTVDPNSDTYLIGPGDNLDIFVWQNPQLSVKVPVRPDGKISIPLVQDVAAVGRTPSALAHEVTEKLKAYVKDPNVTVIVASFVGPFSQQIRVIGEAAKPQALPYRSNMTILDVMIEVGGLTRFAAGDRSVVVRRINGRQQTIKARLDSLINDGDVKNNIAMRPGDIVIIPQRYF